MNQLIPMLCAADVAKSLQWYRDALGFEIDTPESKHEESGRLVWCMMRRGEVRLMLTTGSAMASDNAERRRGRNQTTLYCYPDDVMPIYESLKSKGYEVTHPLVTFYGMKEIVLQDPDGYRVCLGSPTDEPANKGE